MRGEIELNKHYKLQVQVGHFRPKNKGVFKQLNVFDENRMPIYEIDYGPHRGVKSLHVHTFVNGERQEKGVLYLHEGDALYEQYKKFFVGVEL